MAINLIATTTSHRDWVTQFYVRDGDTGEPIDFTGATVAIAVQDSDGCQKISATTDNGKITIISPGYIQMSIDDSEMTMCTGTYQIGGYFQIGSDTIDLLEGTLTVRKGIPRP